MSGLPLHGVPETVLDPEPEEATTALAEAQPAGAGVRLRAIVAEYPAFLAGWAALSDDALAAGDPVAAYAFARTGYHRGLDRIRGAGWRGQGPVPWSHEPNRGFLASVAALMRAAAAIREDDEAQRCRTFLLQLDPEDGQGVRGVTLD